MPETKLLTPVKDDPGPPGVLVFTLLDGETKAPITFGAFYIPDRHLWAALDSSGQGRMADLAPGRYRIGFIGAGYFPGVDSVVITPEAGRIRTYRMLLSHYVCDENVLVAASPARPGAADNPSSDLKAAAAEMYRQYAIALTEPRREAIAGFYDTTNVIRVLNGARRVMTRAQLDSIYRGPWNPPDFFTWDSLSYDALGPGLVMVSGGFRWKGKTRPDTARFLYSALLEARGPGLVIRVEQETARP